MGRANARINRDCGHSRLSSDIHCDVARTEYGGRTGHFRNLRREAVGRAFSVRRLI